MSNDKEIEAAKSVLDGNIDDPMGYAIEILKAVDKVRDQWQPIESAPRDGTPLIIYDKYDEVLGACYQENHYSGEPQWIKYFDDDLYEYDPTHWLPLPKPPTNTKD